MGVNQSITGTDEEEEEEEIEYHVRGRIEVWVTVDRLVYGYASELGTGANGDPIEEAIREELGDMGVDRECAKWITPEKEIIAVPVSE